MRVPEEADRDFTASAFIVRDGEVLLLRHKKIDSWLQPGGHVEPGETPDEAAVREAVEETGFDTVVVEDFSPESPFSVSENLPKPFNINLHPIDSSHYHCDFQYIVSVKDRVDDYEYEDSSIDWFSREDLKNSDLEILENARETALKAIEIADNV